VDLGWAGWRENPFAMGILCAHALPETKLKRWASQNGKWSSNHQFSGAILVSGRVVEHIAFV